MPKVIGIFDEFKNLDQIPIEDIAKWLKSTIQIQYLENYFANRLYYPQAIPVSLEDLTIDLAILREALKRNPEFFKDKKFIIPEIFLSRLPNLSLLILAYVDAFSPTDVVMAVSATNSKVETLGSVVTPIFNEKKGSVLLEVEGKKYSVNQGALQVIPCSTNRCHINFKSADAKILGKEDIILEAFGGKLGVLVDARRSL